MGRSVALIVAIATVLGAVATVVGVLIALRGQRRSRRAETPAVDLAAWETTVERFATGGRFSGLDVDHSIPVSLVETRPPFGEVVHRDLRIDNLLVIDAETHAAMRSANRRRSSRQPRTRVKADVPLWATGLLSDQDAARYTYEWGAHLRQLIEEGQLDQARRDRRMLAVAALHLAFALRLRRVRGRMR
jgi:hypothetical protein